MKLRARLLLLLSVSVFSVLLVAAGGIFGIVTTTSAVDEIGTVRLPSIQGLGIINEGKAAVRAANLSAALFENDYSAQNQFSAVLAARNAAWKRIDEGWKIYEPLPQTPEEARLWSQFIKDWEAWKAAEQNINAEILALSKNSSEEEQRRIFDRYTEAITSAGPLFKKAEEGLDHLIELNVKIAEEEVGAGHQGGETAEIVMGVVGIGAVVGLVMFGALTTRIILGQIGGEPSYAAEVADRIASGDLETEVETKPGDTASMLSAMRRMRESLAKIVTDVRAGADTIATASQQIAGGNQDLSSRTEEQASSLEETASSMEELTSTVRQNADNARQANQLASSASAVASKGGAVVSQVVDKMSAINGSSRKIVDIISVIDGIAFQTNILALNAAVEAARAGEQGRGFAVVASEVRNLAQRSAAAAKEIKSLIDDSVEKVDEGSALVDQAGATMSEIVESVKRVTDIMAEITAASEEQTNGIEQINQAVTQMDEVTQQNAALVEEAAAASAALQDQAGKLSQLVSVFRVSHQQESHSPQRVLGMRSAATTAVPKKRAPHVAAVRAASPAFAAAGAGSNDWEEF